MSELIKTFKAADGTDVKVSIHDVKHHKSGGMMPYFSLTNGSSVAGFYLTDEAKESISSVLRDHHKLSKGKGEKNA